MPFRALVSFLILWSTHSHALYHGRVIASDTKNPIEREILRRTVRVEVAAGECTGVLINARTVRTAGHCFALGGSLVGVKLHDGVIIPVASDVRYVTPPRLFANAASVDQAEIRFRRGIAPVSEIAVLDPRHLNKWDRLVVAGYGPMDEDSVEDDARELSYVYASLEVFRAFGWFTGWRRAYALHPDDEEVFFTDGDAGGPAFVERGGVLKLIGNVSGDPARRSEGMRPAVIRPIGDLKPSGGIGTGFYRLGTGPASITGGM